MQHCFHHRQGRDGEVEEVSKSDRAAVDPANQVLARHPVQHRKPQVNRAKYLDEQTAGNSARAPPRSNISCGANVAASPIRPMTAELKFISSFVCMYRSQLSRVRTLTYFQNKSGDP